MTTRTHPIAALALLIGAALPNLAAAQAASGMELQQPLPPRPLEVDPAALPKVQPAPAPRQAAPGGPTVTLDRLVFAGNTLVDDAELLDAVGPLAGSRFDLAGLDRLTERVMARYRAKGYPFVQAYLPPQSVKEGVLTIQVIEGVYGRIQLASDDPKAAGAQAFLDGPLRPGAPISDKPLERAMLLLDDQPGFRVSPLLRPGEHRGEGDLVVRVERRNHVSGDVGVDNAGSLATGRYRVRGALAVNSPFVFGDRIALAAMATDEKLWLGSADYERPLGGGGLRGQVGVARTSYQLGGAFASLDASGRADVVSARLSWSALRSQAANLLLTAGVQHKALQDRYEGVGIVRDKSSESAVVGAQFDRKDGFGGGGVTYGSANVTAGRIALDEASLALDALTAGSAGHYVKANLDLTRIQRLPGPLSVYARWSGQWASKNLDASEKYGLGGFLGVRAYPMGEASGDKGWLSQLELRWDVAGITAFVFADNGRMRANAEPWDAASDAVRSIGGAGVGTRWLARGWSLEATLAARTQGGPSTAENDDRRLRLTVALGHRFE